VIMLKEALGDLSGIRMLLLDTQATLEGVREEMVGYPFACLH
jgi:hypothetical protein